MRIQIYHYWPVDCLHIGCAGNRRALHFATVALFGMAVAFGNAGQGQAGIVLESNVPFDVASLDGFDASSGEDGDLAGTGNEKDQADLGDAGLSPLESPGGASGGAGSGSSNSSPVGGVGLMNEGISAPARKDASFGRLVLNSELFLPSPTSNRFFRPPRWES
jgi:hypothetical protein